MTSHACSHVFRHPARWDVFATKVALLGGKVSQLDLEPAGATLGSPTTKVTGKGLTEITGPMVKIN